MSENIKLLHFRGDKMNTFEVIDVVGSLHISKCKTISKISITSRRLYNLQENIILEPHGPAFKAFFINLLIG